MRLLVYGMLVNVNGTNMYMYVNKRIELTQQGIALKCMYVLLLLFSLNTYRTRQW